MNNTNNELDATSRGKQQNGEGGGGPGDQQDAENEEANWAMEAEESAIRLKVENGLKHIRDGDRARGKEAFEEVLKNDLKSSKTIKQLRFVAARNLAKALEEESTNVEVEKDEEKRRKLRARALELYVEAVDFDAKDVVVWHRLGTLAQELDNVVLARFAFSQGLSLSPNHQLLLEKYFNLCKSLGDENSTTLTAKRIVALNPNHKDVLSWIRNPNKDKETGEARERRGASAAGHDAAEGGERLSPSAEIKVEVLRTNEYSIHELMTKLLELSESNRTGTFCMLKTEYQVEEIRTDEVEDADANNKKKESGMKVKSETDVKMKDAIQENGKATEEEEQIKGKKEGESEANKKRKLDKEEQPEQPARRSRRVRTLQKEKEEKEKNEIDKIAEEIVTMTTPSEYKSQIESKTKKLDELFQMGRQNDDSKLESANNAATKSSDAKEKAFLQEFAGRRDGKALSVDMVLDDLVDALAANSFVLGAILQREDMRSALAKAYKVLQHSDLSTQTTLFLMEIYFDCMMEERQRKRYPSKRGAKASKAKQPEKSHGEMIQTLGTRLETQLILEVDIESDYCDIIPRFFWNQSRFLRLVKDKKSQEYFQMLKNYLSKNQDKPLGALAWCKHDPCISLESIETACNDSRIDTTLQRSKVLYNENKYEEVVAELSKVLFTEKNPLPLHTNDILEDKTNLSALSLLMEASQKCDTGRNVGMMCAIRLLLAVFVNDISESELPPSTSMKVRKCMNIIKKFMTASTTVEDFDSIIQEVWSEIGFIKNCFRTLLHKCYSKLYISGPANIASTHCKLENPHSCRNQLVDASVGLCAFQVMQYRWFSSRRLPPNIPHPVEKPTLDSQKPLELPCTVLEAQGDTIDLFTSVYNLNMEVQAHTIREGFFLDLCLHVSKLFMTSIKGQPEGIEAKHLSDLGDQMKRLIYSMYGMDLGLQEKSKIIDFPGVFSFSSKRSCYDVWQIVYDFAEKSDKKQLSFLELCFKDMMKFFESTPPDIEREFLSSLLENESLDENVILSKDFVTQLEEYKSKNDAVMSSLPEIDRSIFKNLYRLLIQSQAKLEKDSLLRTCKVYAGHAITPDGHKDIAMEAKPFINHLAMNVMDSEVWLNLGIVYDQAKDLLQNDAAKLIPASQWSTNTVNLELARDLSKKIKTCLLISYALVQFSPEGTPTMSDISKEELLEMLALSMYDAIINVAPEYNQLTTNPVKGPSYRSCLNLAQRFFIELKPYKPNDWRLCLGLGKTIEKLEGSLTVAALKEYERAIEYGKTLLEPLYRLHASRLKLLLRCVSEGLPIAEDVKENVLGLSFLAPEASEEKSFLKQGKRESLKRRISEKYGPSCPAEIRDALIDAMEALSFCLQIHKYHYPAIYRLAEAFYSLGDKQEALEVITSCFKKNKNDKFSINMWEDQALCTIKKKVEEPGEYRVGRAPQLISGVGREESSRKFVSKVRKALSLYIKCLVYAKDIQTLHSMYIYLSKSSEWRCLDDLPVLQSSYCKDLAEAYDIFANSELISMIRVHCSRMNEVYQGKETDLQVLDDLQAVGEGVICFATISSIISALLKDAKDGECGDMRDKMKAICKIYYADIEEEGVEEQTYNKKFEALTKDVTEFKVKYNRKFTQK